MCEEKSFSLKKDYKIFQYHFPEKALFPGALFLDVCQAKLQLDKFCKFNQRAWSAYFHLPCFPEDDLLLSNKDLNDRDEIIIFNNNKEAVKIKIYSKDSELEEHYADLEVISDDEYNKPMANHSKEILFLDKWRILSQDKESIKVVGEYVFSQQSIEFLNEISMKDNFGEMFVLIELMGLTVLSAMAKKKLVDLKRNYGFAKLEGFQYNKHLKSGDKLICVTESRLIYNKFIKWSGRVFCNGKVIAKISEGLNCSLDKEEV